MRSLLAAAVALCSTSAYANLDISEVDADPYTFTLGGANHVSTGDWSNYTGTLIIGTGAGDTGRLEFKSTVNSSATIKVSQDATFWAATAAAYANSFILQGGATATSEGYGNLRVQVGANITGNVLLEAASSIGMAGGGIATVSGVISGDNDLYLRAGNVTTSILHISNANNLYSGKTIIDQGGYVRIDSIGALGTGNDLELKGGLMTGNTAGLTLTQNVEITGTARLGHTNAAYNNKLTFTNDVSITTTGTLTINSDVEFAGFTTISSGDYRLAAVGKLTMSGGGDAKTIRVDAGGGSVTLDGDWTITGLMVQTGATEGTINLDGTITSTGLGGIIGQNVAGITGIVNVNGTVTNSAAVRLTLGNQNAGATGIVNINAGGKWVFTDSTSSTQGFVLGRNSATGELNIFAGGTLETDTEVRDNGDGAANNTAGTAIVNLDGGTIVVTKTLDNDLFYKAKTHTNAIYTVNVLAGGVTIDTQTNDVTIGTGTNWNGKEVLSGSAGDGGLTKKGTGKLTLGNASAYYGKTVIEAGTLALASGATLANTEAIIVKSGATFDVDAVSGYTLGSDQTLGGNGTIKGNITIAGTLSPGESVGNLVFTGNVTLAAGAKVIFEIESENSYDTITLSGGTLSIDDPSVTLSVVNAGSLADLSGTYQVIDGAVAAPVDWADNNYEYSLSITGELTITAVPIPEPSTYALGAAGLLGALVLLRRRRK